MEMKKGKYVDIHCHILPGVDDGAKDWDMTLAMLQMEAKEGVGKVILTPHQKPGHKCIAPQSIERKRKILQEELIQRDISIQLYTGGELLYCHELKERLRNGDVSTLAGSHYVLVEFMPDENWPYIRNGLYQLCCEGYRPIIAHVERYSEVIGHPELVKELTDMGCYIQMNAGSIAGDYGFFTKRNCLRLLKNQQVHFIGTDAHRDSGKRAPAMEKCAQLLQKKTGADYAAQLLYKNAEHIFSDTEL